MVMNASSLSRRSNERDDGRGGGAAAAHAAGGAGGAQRTRGRAAAQIVVMLLMLVGGCRSAVDDARQPIASPSLRPMVRTELYCGLSRPKGPDVTQAEWAAFLDEVVTPRFPDGFSVTDEYGQYREASGRLARER